MTSCGDVTPRWQITSLLGDNILLRGRRWPIDVCVSVIIPTEAIDFLAVVWSQAGACLVLLSADTAVSWPSPRTCFCFGWLVCRRHQLYSEKYGRFFRNVLKEIHPWTSNNLLRVLWIKIRSRNCYHPRSGCGNNFGRVCLSVCLSDNNFRKPWRTKFIFVLPPDLEGIRVKFVNEGHRVKVTITWEKNVTEYTHSRVVCLG